MRHLNVQFQPERAPQLDRERTRSVIEALTKNRSLVAGYETKEGDDGGPYVNYTFLAKDLPGLWSMIRKEVLAHPEIGASLSAASIVVCEGPNGWDDYLLLHHFDPKLPLDEPDVA